LLQLITQTAKDRADNRSRTIVQLHHKQLGPFIEALGGSWPQGSLSWDLGCEDEPVHLTFGPSR